MKNKRLLLPFLIALVVIGCKKTETANTATVVSEPAAIEPAPAATTAATTVAPTPAAPPAAGAVIASQETNWNGVTADITEFRRKGNTLTTKVRLTNRSERAEPVIKYAEVYLMDTAAGKKYEVLKDEKDSYIASLHSGYSYGWWETMKANDAMTLWMKFPAPPAEVKAITLHLPGMAPFEDVPIQD
jgi:hypothetical protein